MTFQFTYVQSCTYIIPDLQGGGYCVNTTTYCHFGCCGEIANQTCCFPLGVFIGCGFGLLGTVCLLITISRCRLMNRNRSESGSRLPSSTSAPEYINQHGGQSGVQCGNVDYRNIIQTNFDISNSDVSKSCEILLNSNSLSQSKTLYRIESWLWGLFFISSNYPKCKFNLHFG